MPTFDYIAMDAAGKRVSGSLGGASERAVLGELDGRHLTPVSITEQKPRRFARRRVSVRALAGSYQQMGDLLGAGVPMLRALRLLGRQKAHAKLAEVYRSLGERVADGGELGEGMRSSPDVFPPVHIAMVRAGERGGFIGSVYQNLGELVSAQAELRSKLLGALVYPAVLVTVGLGILGVIFTFFVPKFRRLFTSRLEDLPWVTDAVFAVGDAVTKYGLFVLIGLVIALLIVRTLAARPAAARTIAAWQLKLPLVGNLIRWLAVARFCRLLGTMGINGVPLLGAMSIARDAAGHPLLEDAIDESIEAVRRGEPLAGPLAASGLFDEEVVEMVRVGEASGQVDAILLRTAEILESRVNRTLTVAVQLVEPLLLLSIALVVAFVAVGLILPLTQLTGTV